MINVDLMMSGLNGKDLVKFKKWLNLYDWAFMVNSYFEKDEDESSLQAQEFPDLAKQGDDHDSCNTKEVSKDQIAINSNEGEQPLTNDPVKPGQIRLLKRNNLSYPINTTFILVLTQWTGDRWLIAPFSPFTAPATEGEMDTGLDSSLYRVVEAWNTVVVQDVLLQSQSVFLRDADDSVRKDACTVFFQKLEGKEIPEELSDRVGPPIRNDLDPRIQYLLNEKYQLEPLREKIKNTEEFLRNMEPFETAPWTQEKDSVLAASDKTIEPVLYLSVANHQERIKVFRVEKEIRFEFYSADFEDYSNTFDSWYIVSEEGYVLGQIKKDFCSFTNKIPIESICLAAPDGNLISLSRIEV